MGANGVTKVSVLDEHVYSFLILNSDVKMGFNVHSIPCNSKMMVWTSALLNRETMDVIKSILFQVCILFDFPQVLVARSIF